MEWFGLLLSYFLISKMFLKSLHVSISLGKCYISKWINFDHTWLTVSDFSQLLLCCSPFPTFRQSCREWCKRDTLKFLFLMTAFQKLILSTAVPSKKLVFGYSRLIDATTWTVVHMKGCGRPWPEYHSMHAQALLYGKLM